MSDSPSQLLPQVELLDLQEDIPRDIYDACKKECNNNFDYFIQSVLIRIGLQMQQFKPGLNIINNEETLRDIVVLACKQYFGKNVTSETSQNGHTDIKFEKIGNVNGSRIVECLRDDTYAGSEYKKKIKQVLGYRDIEETVFLLTFVQNNNIETVVVNAKRQAQSSELNPILPFREFRMTTNSNYRHGFTSKHSISPGEVVIKHIFYDLKIA